MRGRIALVQFRSQPSDKTNVRRMVGFIKRERGRSDLIVFPELAIKKAFSEVEEAVFLRLLGNIAKINKIDLVPGSIMVKSRGKSYNRSYYIDRNGMVLAEYDKSNPWKSERISKGEGPHAFKTRFGRTSLIICWDLESAKIAAQLSNLKLDLIICPSMWWQGRETGVKNNFTWGMIDALCLSRAYESRAILAYANTAGKLKLKGMTDSSAGRTQVAAPFRNIICEMKDSNEGVIRCTIDHNHLILARKYFDSV